MVAHDRLADASRAGRPIPSAKQKGGLREGLKAVGGQTVPGLESRGPVGGVTAGRSDGQTARGTGSPRDRLVVELLMGEQSGHSWRGLLGEAGGSERLRGEGVAAVVQHELGIVVGYRRSLDAQVAEHGVRLPAAEKLDGAAVDAGAEEGGRAAGAQ